ncbi:MAG: cyclic nucleotide-binding domain-containing protein [Pseudomonadota bacterium]
MDDLSRQEQLVDEEIKQNNKEAAVKLLFDLIVQYAKEKNFEKAEALRERLFEVDAMALTEIIRSSEIIEQEKSESIDPDHLSIWSGLYSTLTTEESNALYYAIKKGAYDADQTIFKQGKQSPSLYFINEGQLKLVYGQDDREVLLRTLGPGHIAGEDTFFLDTVCTTSLITLSNVKLSFLDKAALAKGKDEFPLLESKLHDYCLKLIKVQNLLQKRGLDRRTQKRVTLSGHGAIQVVNTSGNPVGRPFKGVLSDISVGGLSFFVKISKKETARALLGRNLNIKFSIAAAETQQKIDQNGTVVAARCHPFGDYSIHVKFDRLLSEKVVEEIERLSKTDTHHKALA